MKKYKRNGASFNKGKKRLYGSRESNYASGKKRTVDFLKIVCWILVPIIITVLLILDALGIYVFSTERLLVLGVGLLIILLPFFSEITLKDLTVKRDKTKTH